MSFQTIAAGEGTITLDNSAYADFAIKKQKLKGGGRGDWWRGYTCSVDPKRLTHFGVVHGIIITWYSKCLEKFR